MQLNSYVFILELLPVLLICYFISNRIGITARKLVLCISGIIFYSYAGIFGTAIFGISIIMNFVCSEIMMEKKWLHKPMLIITIAMNVLILLVFKYSDFVITNYNLFFGKEVKLLNLVLPLGISFFTFQQIAYVICVYNEKIEEIHLLDYITYILYFPKVLMGPIVDPVDLISQFNNPNIKKWDWDNFCSGLKLFSFGLFKKMILADTFALAVSWGNDNFGIASSIDWIIVMLSYTFEIYFDFSGYSDMATGVSIMLNISLPINFNSPYKALSVGDFWDRWHISLTKFLTKYIYIPLGGNRKGIIRTCINIMIVFTISGIWHGSNWTFILWGIIYGVLSVVERLADKVWKKVLTPIRWGITFTIVNVQWLLFSSSSISEWIYKIKKIFTFSDLRLSDGLLDTYKTNEAILLERVLHIGTNNSFSTEMIWCILIMLFSAVICFVPENNYKMIKNNNIKVMIIAAIAFCWGFIYLGTESEFIYNYF